MTIPNLITGLRIILSPLFFVLYFAPEWWGLPPMLAVVLLWVLFVGIELSDLFDGMAARKLNQVSPLGKVLDPFADSFSRLTYFVCFCYSSLMPVWMFLPILYRDLLVSFIRLVMMRQGLVMSARLSGKIKAWVYALAGIIGLMAYTARWLEGLAPYRTSVYGVAFGIFLLSALVAVWTLFDYGRFFLKTSRKPGRQTEGGGDEV